MIGVLFAGLMFRSFYAIKTGHWFGEIYKNALYLKFVKQK